MREVSEYFRQLDKDKNLGYNPAWISKDTDGKYHYSMESPNNLSGKVLKIDTTNWERKRMQYFGIVNWEFVGKLYEKSLKDEKRTNDYGKTRTSGPGRRLPELASSGSSRS